jgi:hypothetical protein
MISVLASRPEEMKSLGNLPASDRQCREGTRSQTIGKPLDFNPRPDGIDRLNCVGHADWKTKRRTT